MGATTSSAASSLFMFVLGLGLGLVMQVLVLAVQNSVDYSDLGVATSGATLFRSIGGSVGTAILGSIFTSGLTSELKTQLVKVGAADKASQLAHAPPSSLRKLPPVYHHLYIQSFTNALGTVFAVAAGVAAVAFLLSWLLPQLALRETVTASTGIGETFAVPKNTDSLAELSRALTSLVGREGRKRLIEQLAERAGVDLAPAQCWVLVRLHFDPHADFKALCEEWSIPLASAQRATSELDERGLLVHLEDGGISPTAEGEAMVERLIAERRASLSRLLEGWSPEQHADLTAFITRLAHELASEPDAELSPTGA
jgi:DNA-binding MarR family transcriptional regulator